MTDSLKDIVKFKAAFWRKLIGGQNSGLIKMIIQRCQRFNQNYKGQTFKPYADWYAEAKGTGDKSKLGIVGQHQESKSTTPDMTLTNSMFWGLKIQTVDDKSGTFGWIGVNAAKVQALAKRKNYQVIGFDGEQVLAEKEEEYITESMEKEIGKKIDSWTNKTVSIDIGKNPF